MEHAVAHLNEAAVQGDPARIHALLQDLVVTYHPGPTGESDEMFAEFLEAAPADVAGRLGPETRR